MDTEKDTERITRGKPKAEKRTKARARNIARQMDIGRGVTDVLRGMAYM